MELIDNEYILTFDLNNQKLQDYEKHGMKSWIYFCTDVGADTG